MRRAPGLLSPRRPRVDERPWHTSCTCEENRDSLCRRLQRRGFEVITAADGEAGVATAGREKPDLILMDMNMPGIDGWEATRRLKGAEATRGVPVLALTAHALSGDRERALDAGCSDYHTKPIEFARLLAQIEATLQDRPG